MHKPQYNCGLFKHNFFRMTEMLLEVQYSCCMHIPWYQDMGNWYPGKYLLVSWGAYICLSNLSHHDCIQLVLREWLHTCEDCVKPSTVPIEVLPSPKFTLKSSENLPCSFLCIVRLLCNAKTINQSFIIHLCWKHIL